MKFHNKKTRILSFRDGVKFVRLFDRSDLCSTPSNDFDPKKTGACFWTNDGVSWWPMLGDWFEKKRRNEPVLVKHGLFRLPGAKDEV